MEVAADLEGVHLCRQHHRTGRKTVVLAVLHGVHGTHEGRHIASGLTREIPVDVPIVAASASADCLVHIAGTAVIGGDGKIPVPENVVEIGQVPCCGIRRLEGIPSLIDKGIDFETVTLGRLDHELPHTDSPYP